MNYSILFALLLTASSVFGYERFDNWAKQHDIQFTSDGHYRDVLGKWLSNDRHIDTINGKNLTYTLAHNQFSGMDSDEFKKYNQLVPLNAESVPPLNQQQQYQTTLPDSVDWVSNGAVTPVKNQGQCGSCWSFSTTGALEGVYYIMFNALTSFSEQQLVDCDNYKHGGKDHGCNGGLMDNAFSWISSNGGLCDESAYPYTSGTTMSAGTCMTSCNNVENSRIRSFTDVPVKSDLSMMTALSKQPISVAIEADQKDFQLYSSGVFTGKCGTNLDHGVLVVGYGTDSSTDYYTIKNSWGTSWGMNGYINIGRGEEYNNGQGQCGVLLQASYPSI